MLIGKIFWVRHGDKNDFAGFLPCRVAQKANLSEISVPCPRVWVLFAEKSGQNKIGPKADFDNQTGRGKRLDNREVSRPDNFNIAVCCSVDAECSGNVCHNPGNPGDNGSGAWDM